MNPTRQPITDDNFYAHEAAMRGRHLPEPYSGARLRDPQEEMVQLFLENPQITQEEMLEHFTEEQIDGYAEGAKREARRRSIRHAA